MIHLLLLLLPLTSTFILPPVDKPLLSGDALSAYVNSAQSQFTIQHHPANQHHRVMDDKYLTITDNTLPIKSTIADFIPAIFDSRINWPNCRTMGMIHNQGGCAASWAMAAVSVMNDRICILSNDTVVLSAIDLISCCGSTCGSKCDGGYPIQAFRYWKSDGIVTGGDYSSGDGCKPYPYPPCDLPNSVCDNVDGIEPKCQHQCSNFDTFYGADKHFGDTSYPVANNVAAIQTEIMTNGPVESTFRVFADFLDYKSGIYKHMGGNARGSQAVKILGWGSENGVDYWLCANSWGANFGENGFFRIERGTNECFIENDVVAGLSQKHAQ